MVSRVVFVLLTGQLDSYFNSCLRTRYAHDFAVPDVREQILDRGQGHKLLAIGFHCHLQAVQVVERYFAEKNDSVDEIVGRVVEDVQHAHGHLLKVTWDRKAREVSSISFLRPRSKLAK